MSTIIEESLLAQRNAAIEAALKKRTGGPHHCPGCAGYHIRPGSMQPFPRCPGVPVSALRILRPREPHIPQELIDNDCPTCAETAESYKRTVAGQCAPDEQHCSCVPALRAEIARLSALVPVGREMAVAIENMTPPSMRARMALHRWRSLDTEEK